MSEKIIIDGRSYAKFIPFPRQIRDGTLRCIGCGQIDEPAYHDDSLCGGMIPRTPQTQTKAEGVEG